MTDAIQSAIHGGRHRVGDNVAVMLINDALRILMWQPFPITDDQHNQLMQDATAAVRKMGWACRCQFVFLKQKSGFYRAAVELFDIKQKDKQ